MRVAIANPPLSSQKGVPLLSQNRQFQWFSKPTYIYPVVPASAATLLQHHGFDVAWMDGVAEELSFSEWFKQLLVFKPDVIFIETKTPAVKQHWKIITKIKKALPDTVVVLAGDHITAYPAESLLACPVDFAMAGGHFDISLLGLCQYLNGEAGSLPAGLFYLEDGKIISTGSFVRLRADLNNLPLIDRKLTKWELYAYHNGNFKYKPGTYTMTGRDCWWRRDGGCTFCSWTVLFPQFSVRTVESLLDEVGELIDLGVQEIFDDTGTFMVGPWLHQFCQGMIDRGYHQKVVMGCNMRYGVLKYEDYAMMAKANFRFILYGLESVNQKTIDRLNKGTDPTKIEAELAVAQQASRDVGGQLEPHVTCMVGYPWETYQDAQNTVNFTRNLFKKGLITTLQATVCMPYPGTALFKQCLENDWLTTRNWDDFDMSRPVMKISYDEEKLLRLVRSIYTSFITPRFIWRTLTGVRSWADVQEIVRSAGYVVGHLVDFSGKKS